MLEPEVDGGPSRVKADFDDAGEPDRATFTAAINYEAVRADLNAQWTQWAPLRTRYSF